MAQIKKIRCITCNDDYEPNPLGCPICLDKVAAQSAKDIPMSIFCENHRCRFHIQCPPSAQDMSYVDGKTKKEVFIKRFKYARPDRPVYLCEICANVINIIRTRESIKSSSKRPDA